MHYFLKKIFPWMLLCIFITGLMSVSYFHLYDYLDFVALKTHQKNLLEWTNQHYSFMVFIYILIFICMVLLCLPGAIFITLTGGFLFGPIATLYSVLSASVGASLVFITARTLVGDWLTKKSSGWVKKMEHGFQKNSFHYVLFMRLLPIFPFWIVSIVSGILNVRFRTFFIATFLGVIPCTFLYVMVGDGLHAIFERDELPDLNIIFNSEFLLPLSALGVMLLIPLFYKGVRKLQWHKKS